MALSKKRRQHWIAAKQQEYSHHYPTLRFLSDDDYARADPLRQQMVQTLLSASTIGRSATKFDMNNLSPGLN